MPYFLGWLDHFCLRHPVLKVIHQQSQINCEMSVQCQQYYNAHVEKADFNVNVVTDHLYESVSQSYVYYLLVISHNKTSCGVHDFNESFTSDL